MLTLVKNSKELALEKMLKEMEQEHTSTEDSIHNWLCNQNDDELFNGIMKEDRSINGAIERMFKDIVLMQYTGLKDKNGVEVYEGDVVRGRQTFTTAPTTPSEVVAVVEYSERNTKFCLNDGSGRHDQFTSCLSLGGSIYQYEVIGNIYENPELLKESGTNE